MIRIVNANRTADFMNAQGGGFEQMAGDTDSPPVQVLKRSDAVVCTELPADAVFADIKSCLQIVK